MTHYLYQDRKKSASLRKYTDIKDTAVYTALQVVCLLATICVFLLPCKKSTLPNQFEINEMWDPVELLRHDYFSVCFTNFFNEPISNKACCRLLYFWLARRVFLYKFFIRTLHLHYHSQVCAEGQCYSITTRTERSPADLFNFLSSSSKFVNHHAFISFTFNTAKKTYRLVLLIRIHSI